MFIDTVSNGASPILVYVSILSQYQHTYFDGIESVKYIIQVPILLFVCKLKL